jgi:hypothetical protein
VNRPASKAHAISGASHALNSNSAPSLSTHHELRLQQCHLGPQSICIILCALCQLSASALAALSSLQRLGSISLGIFCGALGAASLGKGAGCVLLAGSQRLQGHTKEPKARLQMGLQRSCWL